MKYFDFNKFYLKYILNIYKIIYCSNTSYKLYYYDEAPNQNKIYFLVCLIALIIYN